MSTPKSPPPVMRRRAGSLLRTYREAAGLAPGAAAKLLGWDTTRQGRLERGIYRMNADDVRAMLRVCGIEDEDAVREIAAAFNEAAASGWWGPYVDLISRALLDFIILESKAKRIQVQHPAIIPGLLQSTGYIREVFHSPLHPDNRDRSNMLSSIRIARQEVLHRPSGRAELHALISETALLHRFPGAPDVMRDQLRKLADDSKQPNIKIQIVPADVPAYAAANQAMTIMGFVHPWPAAISIDNSLGGNFLDGPDAVNDLSDMFERIADLALPEDESRDLINTHLKERFE
ncbi:DUF5753 domain-containing protein [Streptomyces sp. NPDC001493]